LTSRLLVESNNWLSTSYTSSLERRNSSLLVRQSPTIFCKDCGCTSDGADQFCQNCGAKLSGVRNEQVDHPQVEGVPSCSEIEILAKAPGADEPSRRSRNWYSKSAGALTILSVEGSLALAGTKELTSATLRHVNDHKGYYTTAHESARHSVAIYVEAPQTLQRTAKGRKIPVQSRTERLCSFRRFFGPDHSVLCGEKCQYQSRQLAFRSGDGPAQMYRYLVL
jgi:hypothetical protein